MATLQQKVALAGDVAYRNRLKAAMVEHAFAILAEDPMTVEGWPHRGALARRVLADLDGTADLFLMATAIAETVADKFASANNSSAAISDDQIRAAVSQVWNRLAGADQVS